MAAASEHPTIELEGGGRMPVLGLGVWQLTAGRETEQAVEWALEAGYRHIDTASVYRNEQSVGAALRASGLPREQVFVTTKLMPARLNAERELDASLGRLGLEYVDLYLIHWPLPGLVTRQWRALQALREQRLVRAIGVSNFGRDRLEKLIAGSSQRPAVNQIQFSPLHYRRQLLEYCRNQGVVFEAYSPLALGRALERPAVAAIAGRLERTPAQVVLRWAVQRGAVVIPRSSQQERIRANARVFDFELGSDEMLALDALDTTDGSARARGPR